MVDVALVVQQGQGLPSHRQPEGEVDAVVDPVLAVRQQDQEALCGDHGLLEDVRGELPVVVGDGPALQVHVELARVVELHPIGRAVGGEREHLVQSDVAGGRHVGVRVRVRVRVGVGVRVSLDGRVGHVQGDGVAADESKKDQRAQHEASRLRGFWHPLTRFAFEADQPASRARR